jgi:hypothetical protein
MMMEIPEFFLWTRVGTEAGESLEHILWRKDIERRQVGVFCWGIGNAIKWDTLAELRHQTELGLGASDPFIIFSAIKGKPQKHDVNPSGVVAWASYCDLDGEIRPLPDGVLVTSKQKERAHYALFCASNEPLTFADPVSAPVIRKEALRNIKPPWNSVGDSQNTVAVKFDATLSGKQTYPVSYTARLVPPYVVKLAEPILLSDVDCKAMPRRPTRPRGSPSLPTFEPDRLEHATRQILPLAPLWPVPCASTRAAGRFMPARRRGVGQSRVTPRSFGARRTSPKMLQ